MIKSTELGSETWLAIITSRFTMAAMTLPLSFCVYAWFSIHILTDMYIQASPAVDPNYTTRPNLVLTTPVTKQPASYIQLRVNSSGIRVSWDFYTDATFYYVVYGLSISPRDQWDVEIVNGAVNTTWLPSLRPNAQYTVEVIARLADSSMIRYLGNETVTTENGLFLTDVTDTSVTFWWGGITGIDKYNIIYSKTSDKHPESRYVVPVSSDRSNYTINGLKANTEYTLRVEGVNDTQNMLYPVGLTELIFKTKEEDPSSVLQMVLLLAGAVGGGVVVLFLLIAPIVCLIQRKTRQQNVDRNGDVRERADREQSIRQSQIYDAIDDNLNPTKDVIQHTYFNPGSELSPQSRDCHSTQGHNGKHRDTQFESNMSNGSNPPLRESSYMVPNSPRPVSDASYVEPISPSRKLPDLNLAGQNSQLPDEHYIPMRPSSLNK